MRLTPWIALESSILAFGSVDGSVALSPVLRPTKRLRGCFATTAGSDAIVSSTSGTSGPTFVAARSSSMIVSLSPSPSRGGSGMQNDGGAQKDAHQRLSPLTPPSQSHDISQSPSRRVCSQQPHFC
jgi:hypothetical protein